MEEVLRTRRVDLPLAMTEQEIDELWIRLQAESVKKNIFEIEFGSTDSTPTTDFAMDDSDDELLMELHGNDKANATLQIKKSKPKTFLSKVILYDNVSHDRLLEQKLKKMARMRKLHELNTRRKQEIFMKNLEHKQTEWEKLDSRVLKKIEPLKGDDVPKLKLGKLYHSVGYPYQAAIQHMRRLQLPRATQMPKILPQITRQRRPSSSVSEDEVGVNVFVTKLPKKPVLPSITSRKHRSNRGRTNKLQTLNEEATKPQKDERFLMLASILRERYSPHLVEKS